MGLLFERFRKPKVARNRRGWYALWNEKEKFWVGDEKGVACYNKKQIARYAKTVLVNRLERGDPSRWHFRIKPFDSRSVVHAGEQETPKTTEQSIAYLEKMEVLLERCT